MEGSWSRGEPDFSLLKSAERRSAVMARKANRNTIRFPKSFLLERATIGLGSELSGLGFVKGYCSRAPEHPITNNGGLQTGRDPGGTAGWNRRTRPLGIQISGFLLRKRPRDVPGEERTRRNRGEDDAEEQRGEDDAGRERKTESENAETREQQSEEAHEEQCHLEQLTPGDRPDEGQRSRETPRGGEWLQEISSEDFVQFLKHPFSVTIDEG
ncbi:hypothetical protein NDU88_007717 [Pleurodeles waltl]|uniref:Uncharacterized protein n=1 Tax=Pleurodeles waltl TaxID=8319 RepID=A0AAV7QNU7_PLEWA|nr:hypothetical protein NDU88_007717 [Pleurodeles waltl]